MMEIDKDFIPNNVIINTQNGNRNANHSHWRIIPIPRMGMDRDLIPNNDIMNTQNGNIVTT